LATLLVLLFRFSANQTPADIQSIFFSSSSSTALLEDLADVLTRPSATKRLALIDKTARAVLADYVEAIELVEPVSVPRVVVGDIDHDQVIAAAVAACADLIVSGHRKHLLPLGSHQCIDIIEASEALRRIANG
jgi:uncharacterized protein